MHIKVFWVFSYLCACVSVRHMSAGASDPMELEFQEAVSLHQGYGC